MKFFLFLYAGVTCYKICKAQQKDKTIFIHFYMKCADNIVRGENASSKGFSNAFFFYAMLCYKYMLHITTNLLTLFQTLQAVSEYNQAS